MKNININSIKAWVNFFYEIQAPCLREIKFKTSGLNQFQPNFKLCIETILKLHFGMGVLL